MTWSKSHGAACRLTPSQSWNNRMTGSDNYGATEWLALISKWQQNAEWHPHGHGITEWPDIHGAAIYQSWGSRMTCPDNHRLTEWQIPTIMERQTLWHPDNCETTERLILTIRRQQNDSSWQSQDSRTCPDNHGATVWLVMTVMGQQYDLLWQS